MPIRYDPGDDADGAAGARAIFEGTCVPEEADALLDWLRRTRAPAADLSACQGLHTALAQLLLAAGVHVLAWPPDPLLAACLGTAMQCRQIREDAR